MTLAWLTLLSLAAQDAPRRSDWTIRGRLAPEEVVVQSHRGAGLLAPENTLEAFDLAWSLGTVPEADLRMTKDGVIVAFHDDTFARVVRNADPALKKKGVADLTWDELAQIETLDYISRAGTRRKICIEKVRKGELTVLFPEEVGEHEGGPHLEIVG